MVFISRTAATDTSKMASPAPRNVTKIISALRNFFGQREMKVHNRYETLYSPRSQPDPTLPEGPSHKLAGNYYLTRDGRREQQPPEIIPFQTAITAGGEEAAATPAVAGPPIPGFGYNPDTNGVKYS